VLCREQRAARNAWEEPLGLLVEDLGGIVVGTAFLIELSELHGRDKLKGYDIFSLMKY